MERRSKFELCKPALGRMRQTKPVRNLRPIAGTSRIRLFAGEPKANGADIAADPTLTVAWSSFPANLPRSAWLSVSIPSNGLEVLFTDARVGIRSRFPTGPTFLCRSLSKRYLSFNATETILPSRLFLSNGRFLPQLPPSSFHNQVPGLSSECASRSSRATKLASSLHLLHVQSQRPRGQYPLRRLF